MSKKFKKLPSLFRPATAAGAAWPWPAACAASPRTLSFRAAAAIDSTQTPPSSPTILSDDTPAAIGASPTTAKLTSDDRLIFDPVETNSILDSSTTTTKKSSSLPGSVAVLELESRDPFMDFRKSMEEMVEAHRMKVKDDWRRLEEMLTCYLHVNGRSNHGYIVGAFVDLLLKMEEEEEEEGGAIDDSASAFASSSSTVSFSSCTDSSNGPRCEVNGRGGKIKGSD